MRARQRRGYDSRGGQRILPRRNRLPAIPCGFARCDGTLQLRRQRSSEIWVENPNGITDSNAYAINSAGFAVGYATWYGVGSLYGRHAVYWGGDGTAIDLNSFIDPNNGWLLTQAFAISDTGWIAGVGQFDPDGPGEQPSYPYHVLIHVPATAVPTLPGDFNRDGTIDAADYVVWRKGVGIAPTPENYNLWRANFGRTVGESSASNATVPEPAAAWLLVLGAALGCWRCRQLGERVRKLVGCDTRQ